MPFQSASWITGVKDAVGQLLFQRPTSLKEEMERFYREFDAGISPRQHIGIFEGSALSGVIMTADKGFDWSSLPATSGDSPYPHKASTGQAPSLSWPWPSGPWPWPAQRFYILPESPQYLHRTV
jgi:hypothetical protein